MFDYSKQFEVVQRSGLRCGSHDRPAWAPFARLWPAGV